jgi:septum formation protein
MSRPRVSPERSGSALASWLAAPNAMWLAGRPLLLASASRARRQILEAAGIAVDVEPAEIDERSIEAPLLAGAAAPAAIARHLAREKALAVGRRHVDRFVVGADQTLSCGDHLFTKPATRAAAIEQIAALAGRTHHLHAAVALVRGGDVLLDTVSTAALTMRPLDPSFIERYIRLAGDAVLNSVGAYQVEGPGIHLFERIEGDHFTILGLPLLPLLAALRRHGCLAG